jgi:hypothetical protein
MSSRLVGKMRPDDIKAVQEDFRRGATNVMVCTRGVGARGLNFPSLKFLIEHDLPENLYGGVVRRRPIARRALSDLLRTLSSPTPPLRTNTVTSQNMDTLTHSNTLLLALIHAVPLLLLLLMMMMMMMILTAAVALDLVGLLLCPPPPPPLHLMSRGPPPQNSDLFHHQVGRVGRLGVLGVALILVGSDAEEAMLQAVRVPSVPWAFIIMCWGAHTRIHTHHLHPPRLHRAWIRTGGKAMPLVMGGRGVAC